MNRKGAKAPFLLPEDCAQFDDAQCNRIAQQQADYARQLLRQCIKKIWRAFSGRPHPELRKIVAAVELFIVVKK